MKNIFLLLVVSLLWGTQFMFNELALQSFTPTIITFARCLIGVVTLSVAGFLFTKRGQSNHQKTLPFYHMPHGQLFIIALFEATFPFLLIVWGQQHIDSSTAAILISTIPIFVILINFFKQKRICIRLTISVLLGFVGVAVLLLPTTGTFNLIQHIVGALAILSGACCFAISLFLIKRLPALSKIACSRTILLWASVQMLGLLYFSHQSIHFNDIKILSLFALIILGVFCTGIVYVCYIMLVRQAGVVFTSFANYLVPLIGFTLGILLLGEPLHLHFIMAMGLILLALFLGLPKPQTNM